jgi:hypothetical protein
MKIFSEGCAVPVICQYDDEAAGSMTGAQFLARAGFSLPIAVFILTQQPTSLLSNEKWWRCLGLNEQGPEADRTSSRMSGAVPPLPHMFS